MGCGVSCSTTGGGDCMLGRRVGGLLVMTGPGFLGVSGVAHATEPVSSDGRLGSMVVFFLIAAVFIAPIGQRVIRRSLRERRIALGLEDPRPRSPDAERSDRNLEVPPQPGPGSVEAVILQIDAAAATVESTGNPVTFEIDGELTVGGRPQPRVVTDALLADTARRAGLSLRWVGTGPADQESVVGGRRCELTRTLRD